MALTQNITFLRFSTKIILFFRMIFIFLHLRKTIYEQTTILHSLNFFNAMPNHVWSKLYPLL
jgi:hypothetical protein